MIRFKLFIFLFFLFSLNFASSQERKYELKVQHLTKNITGVDVPYALAINGSIPAPTLKFKLGETAVIHVINETKEPTTLHWHGVLVPWKQDGPQFYNTKIIEPRTISYIQISSEAYRNILVPLTHSISRTTWSLRSFYY